MLLRRQTPDTGTSLSGEQVGWWLVKLAGDMLKFHEARVPAAAQWIGSTPGFTIYPLCDHGKGT